MHVAKNPRPPNDARESGTSPSLGVYPVKPGQWRRHVRSTAFLPWRGRSAAFAAGIAMLATSILGMPGASAHGTSLTAPLRGGHGGVTDSHYFAYACDAAAYNFVTISTRYRYWYGSWQGGVWVPGWRESGVVAPTSGGCQQTNKTPGPIGYYRVCNGGALYACTEWRPT